VGEHQTNNNGTYIFHTALFGKYSTAYRKYCTVGHVCNDFELLKVAKMNDQKCFKPVSKALPCSCSCSMKKIPLGHGFLAQYSAQLNLVLSPTLSCYFSIWNWKPLVPHPPMRIWQFIDWTYMLTFMDMYSGSIFWIQLLWVESMQA